MNQVKNELEMFPQLRRQSENEERKDEGERYAQVLALVAEDGHAPQVEARLWLPAVKQIEDERYYRADEEAIELESRRRQSKELAEGRIDNAPLACRWGR